MRWKTCNSLVLLVVAASAIMGGRAGTTYHVKNSGDDNADGRTDVTAWRTLAKIKGRSFSPGDSVLLKRGDLWRETLTVPSSGSASSPLIFGAYGSGANPVISGATVLSSGWTWVSGSVWSHPFSTLVPASQDGGAVANVFFDGAKGTEVGSIGALQASGNWYYDQSSTLYVFSTTDPATAYRTPGVEVSDRYAVFTNGQSYLVFDGLDATKSNSGGYWSSSYGTHLTVCNCTISYNGMSGLYSNTPFTVLRNVITHHNGVGRHDHGFYFKADSMLAERVTAYDNGGSGLSMNGCSGTIRYCTSHDNGSFSNYRAPSWGFGADLTAHGPQVINFYYNVLYDNYGHGVWLSVEGSVNLFNNVIARTRNISDAAALQVASSTGKITAENNIFYRQDAGSVDLLVPTTGASTVLDYNLYYGTTGASIIWLGSSYGTSQFSSFRTDRGEETHGKTADPMFVDATQNNFQLQAGSPCINAGTDVGLTSDPLGTAVPAASVPDIGAFEYPASAPAPTDSLPRVSTKKAKRTTNKSAQLYGTVNPQGSTTTWHFEYGPTVSYGNATNPASIAAGMPDVTVDCDINNLAEGTKIHYRLVATNSQGTAYGADSVFTMVAVASAGDNGDGVPLQTTLEQNYPNPFNASTVISYSLQEAGNLVVKIYDALGAEACTLVSGYQEAGPHRIVWNAQGYASGCYFVTMATGRSILTRRMLYMR